MHGVWGRAGHVACSARRPPNPRRPGPGRGPHIYTCSGLYVAGCCGTWTRVGVALPMCDHTGPQNHGSPLACPCVTSPDSAAQYICIVIPDPKSGRSSRWGPPPHATAGFWSARTRVGEQPLLPPPPPPPRPAAPSFCCLPNPNPTPERNCTAPSLTNSSSKSTHYLRGRSHYTWCHLVVPTAADTHSVKPSSGPPPTPYPTLSVLSLRSSPPVIFRERAGSAGRRCGYQLGELSGRLKISPPVRCHVGHQLSDWKFPISAPPSTKPACHSCFVCARITVPSSPAHLLSTRSHRTYATCCGI